MKPILELPTSCVHRVPKDFDLYTARKQRQIANSLWKVNCTQTQLWCLPLGSGLSDPTQKASNTPRIDPSQPYKCGVYRTLLSQVKRTPPTSEWPLRTHLLLPFVFGFLANKEGSSASRDLPLVLKSLWARSSRVLWRSREEMSPNPSFAFPENYLYSCLKTPNVAFKRSGDSLLSVFTL